MIDTVLELLDSKLTSSIRYYLQFCEQGSRNPSPSSRSELSAISRGAKVELFMGHLRKSLIMMGANLVVG